MFAWGQEMDKREVRYTSEDDAILAHAKEPTPRINFYEWEHRLNMLMAATMGRTTSTFDPAFNDWNWFELYRAGCTPGQVVDAMVRVWKRSAYGELDE